MKKVFSRLVSSVLATVMVSSSLVMTTPVSVFAASITSAGGWNETIYANLSGVSDSQVTGVSYSGAMSGSLTGEDLQYLVRDANGGVRIDIPGLKPGNYTLTVATSSGNLTKNVTVPAQDRSGYAHWNYTKGVGGYNDDGTLKANAKVLYVTDANKDTVSVTSKDGTSVTGIGHILNSTGQESATAGAGLNSKGGKANNNKGILKKLADDGTPLVVRFIGKVNPPDGLTAYDSADYGGTVGDNGFMARMQSASQVTLEGIGTGAEIHGWGFHFIASTADAGTERGKSFEAKNLIFWGSPEDSLGMEGQQEGSVITSPVERCWVHNCSFLPQKQSQYAESDKDTGDGCCDFKRGNYFTMSYNYYEHAHKTNLVGSSDSSLQFNLSYHHNYWKNCEARGPLTRQANVHMYNNVYEGQTDYAQNTRANAYIFSEYNLFYQCKNPQRVDAGAIKSYNDVLSGCIEAQQATVVTDKNTKVSSGCQNANFDTDPSLSYIPSGNYILQEDVTEAKSVVLAQAGPLSENPVERADTSILSSDRQPTASVQLPYDHQLNSTYITSKNATIDNVIFNINKTDAGYVSTTTDSIGQNIVFNVNRSVNITMTDGGATYPVVLMNDSGVAFLTGSGTAYNLPAGTYMIQSSGFQPEKTDSPAKFKEAKISSLKIVAANGEAPTAAEPTTKEAVTEATTKQAEVTTKAEGNTEQTTEEQSEETTSSVPVDPSGAASMGTYVIGTGASGGTFNVTEKTAKVGNVSFEMRSISTGEGNFRKDDGSGISFKLATPAKVTCVVTNKPMVLVNSTTFATYDYPIGTTTIEVPAGTYSLEGNDAGSNSKISKLVLEATGTVETSSETTSESTTESTTQAPTEATTKESATESTTQAPVGSYSVSVDSVSGKTGETITVPVKVTGGVVSAYAAEVSYDSTALEFVSAAEGNSDEGIVFDYNAENGKVTISATNANNVDSSLLFKLTFKALKAGSSDVSVSFTEFADGNDALVNVSAAKGTVGITDGSVQPSLLGDVDVDGDVDKIDAAILLKHISGISTVTNPVALANADCDGISGIDMRDVIWILNHPKAASQETTTEATTKATTEATTKEATTEATTQAPVGSLTPLAAGDYNASTILGGSDKFAVNGNQSTKGEIKINENGYVEFAVNAGATVTVTYKCGSTNTGKHATAVIDGVQGTMLAGGAANTTVSKTFANAGTYRITAVQDSDTTANILSISVEYGTVVTEATTEATTKATTEATTKATTQATTKETTTESTTQAPVQSEMSHSFDASGTSSSFYAISGNTSTSKGTATYNGTTYNTCLKMESATSITFNGSGTLTLVFDAASGDVNTVKLDGEAHLIPAGGVLVIEDIPSGSHELIKGAGSSNLFYMTLNGSGTVVTEATTEATTKEAVQSTTNKETPVETTTKNQGGSTGGNTQLTDTSSLSVIKTITSNSSSDLTAAIKTLNSSGGKIVIDTPEISVSSNLKISATKKGAIVGVKQADGTYPVLNFSGQSYGTRGITISGSNQIIQNLIVEKAGDNGIWVSGAKNTMEHVIARYNCDSGIQLSDNADGNTLRYCYSYRNCDYKTYGANADGFAPKLGASNTVFEYCYAWDNSDDGWDSYDKSGDKSATVTYLHSACWNNGNTKVFTGEYDKANNFAYGSTDPDLKIQSSSWVTSAEGEMNGNGFKFGSKTTEQSPSVVRTADYCIAFDHKSKGFDNNNSQNCTGNITNCVSFQNNINYQLPYTFAKWSNNWSWSPKKSDQEKQSQTLLKPKDTTSATNAVYAVRNKIIEYVYQNKMPDEFGINFDSVINSLS